MDYEAHWQALYDEMRTALDNAGKTEVDLAHVFTGESPLIKSMEPPLLVYRQEVERSLGTVGGGAIKVLSSNFMLTSYADNLPEALAITSAVVTHLTAAEFGTTDGYTTTHIKVNGVQSLYEQDSKLYAVHTRILWERSA